jgi:hypothetical protein
MVGSIRTAGWQAPRKSPGASRKRCLPPRCPPSGIKAADHPLPASPDGRSKPDANTQGSVVRRRRRPALVRPFAVDSGYGARQSRCARHSIPTWRNLAGTGGRDLGFQSGTPIRFATSR